MISSKIFPALPLLAFLVLATDMPGMESRVKLAGSKEVVMGTGMRATILEVGNQALARADEPSTIIEEDFTPFAFEKKAVETRIDPVTSKVVEAPRVVRLDDGEVLARVADSFGKSVRGVMQRGSKSFLQLQGGTLLSSGTTFPAKLPQFKGKTFSVKVIEIDSDGYVLELGSERLRRSINAVSAPASKIQFNP